MRWYLLSYSNCRLALASIWVSCIVAESAIDGCLLGFDSRWKLSPHNKQLTTLSKTMGRVLAPCTTLFQNSDPQLRTCIDSKLGIKVDS